MKDQMIEKNFELAKEQFAENGVNVDSAIKALLNIPISIHCWQGDDVGGFETPDAELSGGGIQAVGNYPGKARNATELRADFEQALKLIPGKHRINLHAIYAETNGKKVDRRDLQPEHFQNWIDWGKENLSGIDFNPSLFSHPMAESGFTLSSSDEKVRDFWVKHVEASRKITAHIGKEMKSPCVNNIWIPDGYKDIPVDRMTPRENLKKSLDEILKTKYDKNYLLDAVESKLFGIGSESYVVGSHEFYMGYAVQNQLLLCLDMGHFHPTEVVSDKISSAMLFVPEILLHVSRGVRWDSDHVVILSDELRTLAQELVRGNFINRTHIGLDFFDASINRIGAWVIGTRAMQKALLQALLEPSGKLKAYETEENYTARLAMLEENKQLPWGAVWDYLCLKNEIPCGMAWYQEVQEYEKNNLSNR
jgi:L-rhamnose isomerase